MLFQDHGQYTDIALETLPHCHKFFPCGVMEIFALNLYLSAALLAAEVKWYQQCLKNL